MHISYIERDRDIYLISFISLENPDGFWYPSLQCSEIYLEHKLGGVPLLLKPIPYSGLKYRSSQVTSKGVCVCVCVYRVCVQLSR